MASAIIFLPFFSFLFCFLFGKYFKFKIFQISSTFILFLSALLSWIIFFQYLGAKETQIVYILNWITSGSFIVDWSIRLDTLTAVMFIVEKK